jgi:glutamate-1-semialdehyde 2,1-aminomutase
MVGTFNGNPLTMVAVRTMLNEVAIEEAYARISDMHESVRLELEAVIAEHDLPAHVVTVGAKGCVTFSREPVRNYRDFLEVDDRYNHLHWLYQHNRGVFLPPWGKTEQWLISVQHARSDLEGFTDNFRRFAEAVSG